MSDFTQCILDLRRKSAAELRAAWLTRAGRGAEAQRVLDSAARDAWAALERRRGMKP